MTTTREIICRQLVVRQPSPHMLHAWATFRFFLYLSLLKFSTHEDLISRNPMAQMALDSQHRMNK
jgi:hypothetical protein